ncbi:DNA repair protein Rev1p [Monosporozyma unispora]|nr:deoxycytidyl transferase [Kazachstania unispora]
MVYTRGDYFANKEEKQFSRDEHSKGIKSNLFNNCIIYVNGYTKPWNRLKLHKEIVAHGGTFKQFLTKLSGITHIIASNLPLKKRIQFQNRKVVTPNWIIDSIEQGKLLPWQDYSLLKDTDELQRKLVLSKTTPNNNTSTDCNDPNFIVNYLANSRLHLLSDWKSQLRSTYLTNNKANHISPHDEFIILHIDFDSFFATVSYLYRPASFQNIQFDKDPIVVCHGQGSSDIASCNYVARKYGIKNGMWVKHAMTLLPHDTTLITLPYNFEVFKITSQILFDTLNNEFTCFNHKIIPISIDECIALLPRNHHFDDHDTIQKLCKDIRDKIFELTQGCIVSIGVGYSQVSARLALKLAKPDGVYIDINNNNHHDNDEDFLTKIELRDLPGLGPTMQHKLHDFYPNIKTLSQLLHQFPTIDSLRQMFGNKLGLKMYLTLQGQDDDESKRLIYDTENLFTKKSISLEINWGIRFQTMKQIDQFLARATTYLIETKLIPDSYRASSITLKILKRAQGAPIDPPKYLGCGRCDTLSQSSNLGVPSGDSGIITTELQNLFRILACPPLELRGVGIHFQKLVQTNTISNKQTTGIETLLQRGISPSPQLIDSIPTNRLSPIPEDEPQRRKRQISPLKKSRIYNNFHGNDDDFNDIPSTFQRDFLNELPTQIRNEIKQERKIDAKAKRSKLATLQQNIAKRENEELNKTNHFMGKDSIFEPIKFQHMEDFKQICTMIVQWIRETITDSMGPHQKDVKLFKKYLIKLYNANKVHLVLRIANIISTELNLNSTRINKDMTITQSGLQEWDKILLNVVIPILHQNHLTFQSERKISIEYDV